MPKVTFENATELLGTKVDRVSLVKNAANRIPFRVVKSEDETMLDLAKVGQRLFKKDTPPPTIAAVLLSKSCAPALAELVVQTYGLDGVKLAKADTDDHTTLSVEGADLSGAAILKVNDDVALAVTGLAKGFSGYDFSSTAFKDVAAAGSFFPSVSMALDMMRTTALNIMDHADSPSEAAEQLQKAGEDFAGYVATLAKAIPSRCFKQEAELLKALPAFLKDKVKEKGKDGDAGNGAKSQSDEDDKAKNDVKKEEISAAPVNGSTTSPKLELGTKSNDIEGAPAAGGTASDKPQLGSTSSDIEGLPVAGSTTSPQPLGVKKEDVEALFADFGKTLTDSLGVTLQGFRDEMAAGLAEVKASASAAAEQAVQKSENLLHGMVFGEPEGDRTGVKKSDASSLPPLLDTAYGRIRD